MEKSVKQKQMLAGVKVLDISNYIAGPSIATNLADYGADVIKVEHPKIGDYIRNWGKKKNGIPLAWKVHGRNKRLLSADLNSAEGQEIVRKLAAQADIMIESYRPGKLEEWNLDYGTLSAVNPKLILVRLTCWGQNGPYKDQPGFGAMAEAVSGFCHITGQADGPPTLPTFALGDGVAGLAGTYAVMMALYHRDVHGGPGQVVDVSLFESLFSILGPMATEYDQLGIVQNRSGNRSPRAVPKNTYKTADGRWVVISASAGNTPFRLFRAIGRDDMVKDPRYATGELRLKVGDEVDKIVADWIKQRTLREVLQRMEECETPVAPVYDIAQIMEDPQYQAREAIIQVMDEDLGPVKMANLPVKFSSTPGQIRHTGRTAIGYDTVEILKSIGMSDEQIEELSKKEVIRKVDRNAAAV
jgi:crotonobetainyl-CoA:carnitine CoA-transferase CaiB-like acyl-CoA transferase